MMWQAAFGAANLWALLMWIVLVAFPRKPLPLALILYGGIGLLCLAYALAIAAALAGGGGGFDPTTIEGVRSLFATDAGVTIGWLHYLALDLFAGLWIARDADDKGFSRWLQAPFLVLTYLVGPVGLLVWLAVRERRARRPRASG